MEDHGTLVFLPGPSGPFLRFVPPQAEIGRLVEIDIFGLPFRPLKQDSLFQGECPARVGPVRVYRAAPVRKKGTGLFLVFIHGKQHVRQIVRFPQHYIHVAVQKGTRSDPKPVLETEHVIRIEKKVQISATTGEAIEPFMTPKEKDLSVSEMATQQHILLCLIDGFHCPLIPRGDISRNPGKDKLE